MIRFLRLDKSGEERVGASKDRRGRSLRRNLKKGNDCKGYETKERLWWVGTCRNGSRGRRPLEGSFRGGQCRSNVCGVLVRQRNLVSTSST